MTCARHLELFFDVVCPFAYLGSTQVETLCQRVGATLSWHPMLLGGVFQALGAPTDPNQSRSAARLRHTIADAYRWADHLGVPLRWHDRHPVRTLLPMRVLTALSDPETHVLADPTAAHALFRGYWVDGRDLDDPAQVAEVLTRAGLDGPGLVDAAGDPAVKGRLRAASDAAAARGVFGAPAMFVAGELYWGQDRLDFVERALTALPG